MITDRFLRARIDRDYGKAAANPKRVVYEGHAIDPDGLESALVGNLDDVAHDYFDMVAHVTRYPASVVTFGGLINTYGEAMVRRGRLSA